MPKSDGRRGKPKPAGANVGRPRGALNKLPLALKEMVLTALDKAGGVEYLERQANEQPVAFMGLVGRCLVTIPPPLGSAANPFQMEHTVVKKLDISGLSNDQLDVLEGVLRHTKMLTLQGKVIDN